MFLVIEQVHIKDLVTYSEFSNDVIGIPRVKFESCRAIFSHNKSWFHFNSALHYVKL